MGSAAACLAPALFFITAQSLPLLMECAAAGDATTAPATLPDFFLQLVASGTLVYCLPVDCCLGTHTLQGYLFADAFFKFNEALANGTSSEGRVQLEGGVCGAGEQCSMRSQSLADFRRTYASGQHKAANGSAAPSTQLPLRFRDASLQPQQPGEQPVGYSTTNHEYGWRRPSQQDLPTTWAAMQGSFTKGFAPRIPRTTLRTAISRSRIHRDLEEL
jgi:hypothetical protein